MQDSITGDGVLSVKHNGYKQMSLSAFHKIESESIVKVSSWAVPTVIPRDVTQYYPLRRDFNNSQISQNITHV